MKVIIIGAGPAGLTAASKLSDAGIESIVCEKEDQVGGISKTVNYNGYHFDIGGHRFFTKVKAVQDMWHRYLKDDFLFRSRTSRIYFNNKYFDYPLKPVSAFFGLGIKTSTLVLISYTSAKLFPIRNENNFEDFVTNRFGKRLYNIFFKTYTEKVWGVDCSKISAEWAAQRIKGLSLKSALSNALFGNLFKSKQTVVKTLIDSFHYPKYGPGMMWEAVTDSVKQHGSDVQMNTDVTKIGWDIENGVVSHVETRSNNSQTQNIAGTHFISSMPIKELINKFSPSPPSDVIKAANKLNYRDFLTVALVINKQHLFSDNWIYIHDVSVKVGRVQNFKNWSPSMVPDDTKTCLGLEYFCFEGDGLWTMPDKDLLELGAQEMEKLGFFKANDIIDGTVVRMPKAYPVYDETYADALMEVRRFLDTNATNLQLVGRNGMHKYNNQDHSMLTAMLAVENIQGASNDLWAVNVEKTYHEEFSAENDEMLNENSNQESVLSLLAETQPKVPLPVSECDKK